MNFSGVSSRSVVGKILRLPLRLVPKNAVVPILQGPLRGKRWIVGSSSHGCWLGSYEFEKQRAFINHIQPGQVVFDIGAHVGFYTLLSSTLVGESGRVFAFEPYPPNAEQLHRHLLLNKVRNVEVVEAAVSDRVGSRDFQIAENSSMGHLSNKQMSGNTVQVRTIALDQYMVDEGLPRPDVIKVDVEGEEFNVLQGAAKVFETGSVKLFLATHGAEVHKSCLGFLRDRGYSVSSLDENDVETTSEVYAAPHGAN